MSHLNLNQLQQWIAGQLLENNLSDTRIQHEIKSSYVLSAEKRLHIYQAGYKLRLLECMKAEFAVLHTFLGNDLFELFSLGYIQQYPSQSYTLYDLGRHFPAFLSQTKPPMNAVPPEQQKGLVIPEQLAQLEHYRAMSTRGTGCEQITKQTMSELDLLMGNPLPQCTLPDTSFILHCDFDLLGYVNIADQGETPDFPTPEPQQLLIYRHHYRVNMVKLETWQALFIQAIKEQSALSLQQIAQQAKLTTGELLAKLSLWLPTAIELSYLTSRN